MTHATAIRKSLDFDLPRPPKKAKSTPIASLLHTFEAHTELRFVFDGMSPSCD